MGRESRSLVEIPPLGWRCVPVQGPGGVAGGVDGTDEPLSVCGEELIESGVARASGVAADAGERYVGALPPLLGYVGGLLVADGVWREDAFGAGDPGPDDDRGAVPLAVAEVGGLPTAVASQLVGDDGPADVGGQDVGGVLGDVIYLAAAAVSYHDTSQVDHGRQQASHIVTTTGIAQILNDPPGQPARARRAHRGSAGAGHARR